jgi:gamma-glutamyltranspeptidase/glutathione hydrolase
MPGQLERPFQARPDLHGSFGMCASTHWLASSTAQSVLERGGNAYDAAAAAAFVLHIVEPHLNGPGGDVVAIVAPAGQQPRVLAGQGCAPAGATISHYRDEGLELVPGSGALAAAVPGAVDAWLLLVRDLGTWNLEDVLAYAIHYAERGHQLLGQAARVIATVAELFEQHWPTSAAQWMPGGKPPVENDVVRNPVYAATLRRLIDESEWAAGSTATREQRIDAARRIWSSGFVAKDIAAFIAQPHRHSTGADHAGVMTIADMQAFSATWEPTVHVEFRGTTVHKAGGWTQGPALLQTLTMLDGYSDSELDLSTVDGVHRVVETIKLAMADRDAYYGDGMDPAVLDHLLSGDYAAARRNLIGPRADNTLRPGDIGRRAYHPMLRTADDAQWLSPSAGEPTVQLTGSMRGDTCHIDVIDQWGNAISATPSGGWLQSNPTIPTLGFCLGSRLQMSWLDDASPSALRPGRRPRTTLTPTMLTRHGETISALGTPGGDQQEQWQLLYLLRVLTTRSTPQQAIEAPAFHSTSFPVSFWPRTWTPGGLVLEGRWDAAILHELAQRGHNTTVTGDWMLGRLSSVSRDPITGMLSAAANPRGAQGYAVGR